MTTSPDNAEAERHPVLTMQDQVNRQHVGMADPRPMRHRPQSDRRTLRAIDQVEALLNAEPQEIVGRSTLEALLRAADDLQYAQRDADRYADMHREAREDYARACRTIADMHDAAVGEVRGPNRGVVEDVADLRSRWLAADEALSNALRYGPRRIIKGDPAPPTGSVVIDKDGDAWQRRGSRWQMAGGGYAWTWRSLSNHGPLTLVHNPQEV